MDTSAPYAEYLLTKTYNNVFSPTYTNTIHTHLLTSLTSPATSTTSLFWAATTNNEPMVRLTLTHGHNLLILLTSALTGLRTRIHASTGMHEAPSGECEEELVRYVLGQGVGLVLCFGEWWGGVLHWAVKEGEGRLLDVGLERGASCEVRDSGGRTALHVAVGKGDCVAVRVLLGRGADVGAKDGEGRTVVEVARRVAEGGGVAGVVVVGLVLENVEDRGYVDGEGVPLLHLAVRYGHLLLVRDLLDKRGSAGGEGVVGTEGVDVGVVDLKGRTALHVAVEVGDMDVTAYLLDMGADPTIRDHFGRDAYGEVAPKRGKKRK